MWTGRLHSPGATERARQRARQQSLPPQCRGFRSPGLRLGGLDEPALKLWRERRRLAEEAEERAWDELTDTPFFQSISRHDLDEFELGELQADLARCQPVARAWLVRKNLREFPHRRCCIVFLELPQLDDEDRYDLCRSLERSLDLPGPALVLWAGYSPTPEEIGRHAFDAVYARTLK